MVWFCLRLRLGSRFQGRPRPAQGPRRPPGAHPLLPPPPPPPFAASPAPGRWLRTPVPRRTGGGKDGGGCGPAGSRGRLRATAARETEGTGGASETALGSQMPLASRARDQGAEPRCAGRGARAFGERGRQGGAHVTALPPPSEARATVGVWVLVGGREVRRGPGRVWSGACPQMPRMSGNPAVFPAPRENLPFSTGRGQSGQILWGS